MLAKFFAPMAVKVLAGISAFLLIALSVQTARLHIRTAQRDSYKLAAETLKKSYIVAQAAAEAEQKAYYASISARYSARAQQSETTHAQVLEGSQRATDGYIAANRVRAQTGSAPSQSGPAAQGGNPAVPDDAAAQAELVAVKEEDVHICAADYAYSKAAYDMAQGLIVDGLAAPLAAPGPAFGQPESEKR